MEYAKLTPEEQEVARDLDALCWGSLDVKREDVEDQVRDLSPETWARVKCVLMERVEAARVRQRKYERTAEVLRRLIELLKS